MLIKDAIFTAIDFESAGARKGETDVPVQVGTTTWSIKNGITDTWMSYIYTEREIMWQSQRIHGITRDDLKNAPKMPLLWPEFKKRLSGHVTVAHGFGTEKRFLGVFPGHGFNTWVDTLKLTRAAWPSLPKHKLSAVSEHCNVVSDIEGLIPGRCWHDALYDAAASIFVLKHIIETFELHDLPVSALTQPKNSAWYQSR